MSDATLSLMVLAVTVALFIWNRLPVGLVAVVSALALYVTGVVDATTAVSGFGDPVVVFIACLFVVAAGLERSGVTAWAGRALVRRAGSGRTVLMVSIMLLAAVFSAFVTPNGSAAAMLPVVVLAARHTGQQPSRLLMPMSFAAIAGALLVLSGGPTNVIVSDALADVTGAGFGFFEFGLMGVPLLVVTIAVSLLLRERLLPVRDPDEPVTDVSDHLETLLEHYRLEEGFTRVRVRAGSTFAGLSPEQIAVPDGVTLVGVQHADGAPGEIGEVVLAGDVVVVAGATSAVAQLVADGGVDVVATALSRETREALLSREAGVAEVVVPPRSALIGQRVFPGQVRSGLGSSRCAASARTGVRGAPMWTRATCCCCTGRGSRSRPSHRTATSCS